VEAKPVEEAAAPASTTEPAEAAPVATENGEAAADEAEDEEGDDEEEDDEEEDEDLTKNDEQVKDEAEAEEISNLQRSWEMFELAKLVYTKNFETDPSFKNKRVAECLLKLGEISIEQEIYDQAINDIGESIRMQEELKEQRDERMLAESFYQLALAQQFNNLFSEANESYQKSINIMQLRIEKLKGKLEALGADADSEAERNTVKDEIAELESLLPDMQSKLEEVSAFCMINKVAKKRKDNKVGEMKQVGFSIEGLKV
jgi:nuclear autoantigenic sperm protein